MEIKNVFCATAYRQVVETLADGSKVFNVEFIDENEKSSMVVNCADEDDAEEMLSSLTFSNLERWDDVGDSGE